MPPIIGVTRCSRLDDYVASIEAAGATARILEVTESPRSVVGEVDGVLLTGGGDVDPVFYSRSAILRSTTPSPVGTSSRSILPGARSTAICRSSQSAAGRRC